MVREDIVVRKLTADGDGTGEEKRILHVLSVLRNAHKGIATKADATKALRSLDTVEINCEKQMKVSDMCAQQKDDYMAIADDISKQISLSHSKMEEAKVQLAEARQIRRNRQEYDLLAQMIEGVPSRAASKRRLEELAEELSAQQERQKVLEAKLAERRNHLHAFNIILANFQKFLDDEEKIEESEEIAEEAKKEKSEEPVKKEKEDKKKEKEEEKSPMDEGEI